MRALERERENNESLKSYILLLGFSLNSCLRAMSQDILLSLYKYPLLVLQCIVCTSYNYCGIIRGTARLQLKVILRKKKIPSRAVRSIMSYCNIQIRVTDVGFISFDFPFKLFLAKVKVFGTAPSMIIQTPTAGHGTKKTLTINESESPPLFSYPSDETIIRVYTTTSNEN